MASDMTCHTELTSTDSDPLGWRRKMMWVVYHFLDAFASGEPKCGVPPQRVVTQGCAELAPTDWHEAGDQSNVSHGGLELLTSCRHSTWSGESV